MKEGNKLEKITDGIVFIFFGIQVVEINILHFFFKEDPSNYQLGFFIINAMYLTKKYI